MNASRRSHRRADSPTTVRDVIVCGPPRSGTSLLTQIVASAGHRQLDQLIGSSESNPHGFCEDVRVNRLNDQLLGMMQPLHDSQSLPRRLRWLGAFEPMSTRNPVTIPSGTSAPLLPEPPYVMKDPRFAFTLPAWLPHLDDPVVIVCVRSAASIATSLVRMVRREPSYFEGICPSQNSISRLVEALWNASYRSVLEWSTTSTYFVDATRIDGAVLNGLGEVVGTEFTTGAVDSRLGGSDDMPGVVVDSDLHRLVRQRVESDHRLLADPLSRGSVSIRSGSNEVRYEERLLRSGSKALISRPDRITRC